MLRLMRKLDDVMATTHLVYNIRIMRTVVLLIEDKDIWEIGSLHLNGFDVTMVMR